MCRVTSYSHFYTTHRCTCTQAWCCLLANSILQHCKHRVHAWLHGSSRALRSVLPMLLQQPCAAFRLTLIFAAAMRCVPSHPHPRYVLPSLLHRPPLHLHTGSGHGSTASARIPSYGPLKRQVTGSMTMKVPRQFTEPPRHDSPNDGAGAAGRPLSRATISVPARECVLVLLVCVL